MTFLGRLFAKFRQLMQMDYTPRKLATAFAVGMLIGLSPYIGFHTAIAVGISFMFNLPIYPLIFGAYITNPFTFIPIYAFTYKFGSWITGQKVINDIDWSNLQILDFFSTAKSFFWPFWLGTHVFGLILSIFTYVFVYYITIIYRKKTNGVIIPETDSENK